MFPPPSQKPRLPATYRLKISNKRVRAARRADGRMEAREDSSFIGLSDHIARYTVPSIDIHFVGKLLKTAFLKALKN